MTLTDLDVDRGMDHVDHMGTEAWRRQQIIRIEQLLEQLEGALMNTPKAGDIGEPLKHIEVVPLTEPATQPAPEEVPA